MAKSGAVVFRASFKSQADYNRILRVQPRTLAFAAAKRIAPQITGMAQESYDNGQTVYGDARLEGVKGPLSLYDTGDTRSKMRFVATGSIVSCFLGTTYAKYLIGKYRILPIGDRTKIPVAWDRAVRRIIDEEVKRYFGKAA